MQGAAGEKAAMTPGLPSAGGKGGRGAGGRGWEGRCWRRGIKQEFEQSFVVGARKERMRRKVKKNVFQKKTW